MQRQISHVAMLAAAGWLALAAQAGAADAALVQADDPYFKQAQAQMQRILTQSRNTNRAKNVILVVGDGMGFSFHVTTMYAGEELKMHYQNHLEAVFVLKGTGTIEDLGTGETHKLAPGVMYALNNNDKHVVRPETDILTVCAFNPPVTGQEVHDESGAYPADVEAPEKAAVNS